MRQAWTLPTKVSAGWDEGRGEGSPERHVAFLHVLPAKRVLTSTPGKSVFAFMTSIILYATYSERHKRFLKFIFTLWPFTHLYLRRFGKILIFYIQSSFMNLFVLRITVDARSKVSTVLAR
jgi:hypothetical protein